MEYEEIAHRCFRCGFCKFTTDYQDFNCPSYAKFGLDTYAAGGRMWLIHAWLKNELQTSENYAKILYSCVTCGNCKEHCALSFRDDILNIFEAAKSELVSEGLIPPPVRDYFKALSVNGNPYKEPQSRRDEWSEGTGIKAFDGQDYLYYVGDVGSYDERGRIMARNVGVLLDRVGVSFGILGSDETSDGNDAKALGEKWLFEALAERLMETLTERNVKKIITLDPHAFNAMLNDYNGLKETVEVQHYTQVLSSLVQEGVLRPGNHDVTVTYHDPCYLGRHNREYEAPRRVLASIPSLRLKEMGRNRENSFCCGGGGGNFFTDILGIGTDSPARMRVREAMETGAEVICAACPMCSKMLDDALKAEGLEERMRVEDVAVMVLSSLD